jgi:membrane protein implicated in regulation of membrane protease activity
MRALNTYSEFIKGGCMTVQFLAQAVLMVMVLASFKRFIDKRDHQKSMNEKETQRQLKRMRAMMFDPRQSGRFEERLIILD